MHCKYFYFISLWAILSLVSGTENQNEDLVTKIDNVTSSSSSVILSGVDVDEKSRQLIDFDYTPWANASTDLDTWQAPHHIRKEYPYYISGQDSERRPIWVLELGRWNVRKIVEKGGEDLKIFEKYIEQATYRSIKSIRDRSTPEDPVTSSVLIADFDGFDLVQVADVSTVSFILESARRYRSVTSKDLHAAIVVNVNAIASTLVNLLRSVYTEIFSRIEVYGTNRARWIPQLLKYCPKDQLPPWYGGNKDWKPAELFG